MRDLKRSIKFVSNVEEVYQFILRQEGFIPVILHGRECAWNPDEEFKGFVKNTLKTSGYDLLEFGYN